MDIEWDYHKAAQNYRKHRIQFEVAARVFSDRNRTIEQDDRFDYGERRFKTVGMAGPQLLSVIYTERGNTTRLISARKATRHEQEEYYQVYA